MRLLPQCFGPELLGIALRMARTAPYAGTFASIDTCPALSAFYLLRACMAALDEGSWRSPYVAGFTRYVVGEGRAAHLDPAPPGTRAEHHRIVILLHRASEGGELDIAGDAAALWPGDAVVFRADEQLHQVRPVRLGLRLAFTCGALL